MHALKPFPIQRSDAVPLVFDHVDFSSIFTAVLGREPLEELAAALTEAGYSSVLPPGLPKPPTQARRANRPTSAGVASATAQDQRQPLASLNRTPAQPVQGVKQEAQEEKVRGIHTTPCVAGSRTYEGSTVHLGSCPL